MTQRIVLEGEVVIASVARIERDVAGQRQPGPCVIDFGRVNNVDSSAVALMIGWMRDAAARGESVSFANIPPSLASLARLYGVESLLPLV
jgi:phospholipid transport system transporter-binding protein